MTATVTGASSLGPDEGLAATLVQVRGTNGTVGGVGFLIAPDTVLTCAHVVSVALGRDARAQELPAGTPELEVGLRLGGPGVAAAEVWRWVPIRDDDTGDVAVLRLREELPAGRPAAVAEIADMWKREVAALGFTKKSPSGLWHAAKLLGRTADGRVQLTKEDGSSIERGFSGSPVWDVRAGAVVGMVVATLPGGEHQSFLLPVRTLLAELPELRDLLRPPSPFRGLAPFREEDGGCFYGREREVADVVRLVRGDKPWVTVYGPSGCGKSSLVLAGVVPALRREDGYDVAVVRPAVGGSVRRALASALVGIVEPDVSGDRRLGKVTEFADALTGMGPLEILQHATGRPERRLLVVLDQGEELLAPDAAQLADEAVELLFPARPPEGLRVLVTLRSDFMAAAQKHPRVGPALDRGATRGLIPMTRDQLEQVVRRPLERVPGADYETGLVERILDDAGDDPGVLPLLGFVLQQLWEGQAEGRLRFTTYQRTGGVRGAVRQHADRAWSECVPDAAESTALRLLTALVRVVPEPDAPVLRQVRTRGDLDEEQWRIAAALARRRLLVVGREQALPGEDTTRRETVELAHESLITEWPTLRARVEADRGFLQARARLRRDPLPRRRELGGLEEALRGREAELTEDERGALRRARRSARVWLGGFCAALIAVTVVIAVVVQQSVTSARRLDESRSRELATLSEELNRQDPGLAALAAVAAHDMSPTPEARSALLRRYDEIKDTAWRLSGTQAPIDAAATSADGAVTLATTQLGRATLLVRDPDGKRPVRKRHLPIEANAVAPLVSRDGRRVAYSAEGGALVWYEVNRSAEDAEHLLGPEHRIEGGEDLGHVKSASRSPEHVAAFSPDGRRVVTGAGRLRIWDLDTGKHAPLPGRAPQLQQVWFGPHGDTVLGAHPGDAGSDSVVAVDIATGRTRVLAKQVRGLAVSADGAVVTVCEEHYTDLELENDPVFRTLRVADGRQLGRYKADGGVCEGFALDEDGDRLAVLAGQYGWVIAPTHQNLGKAPRALGLDPSGSLFATEGQPLRLTGSEVAPVVIVRERRSVDGLRLVTGFTDSVGSPALFQRDGEPHMAARVADGRRLAVLRIIEDDQLEPVEQADRPRAAPSDTPPDVPLRLNPGRTLVADAVGTHRIQIRELDSLRLVTEVEALEPPANAIGQVEPLTFFFLGDDELLTQSGSRIERWDARTGRRLARPADLRDLRLSPGNPPPFDPEGIVPTSGFWTAPDRRPGYLRVVVDGDPTVYSVDLSRMREDRTLRTRFGRDSAAVAYSDSGRYAAVQTRGGLVELWSVAADRKTTRVLGPFGPLGQNDVTYDGGFAFGFLRDEQFYLANGNTVRFYPLSGQGIGDSYAFTRDQKFLEASADGRTLVRSRALSQTAPDGDFDFVDVFRLDPALWKERICEALGHRTLADGERGQVLPDYVPGDICGK